jgi:endosialidase-like protein
VAGTIRARGGIRFEDGTVLTSAGQASANSKGSTTNLTALNNPTTSSAISGSGTNGKLVKWVDGAAGTLGDSAIAESAAGNVGIGTTTPNANGVLHVNKSQNTGTSVFVTNDSEGSDALSSIRVGLNPSNYAIDDLSLNILGANWPVAHGAAFMKGRTTLLESDAANFGIGNINNVEPILFYTTAARLERMRLTADGNLGIGTTNPTARLDVAGNVKISGPTTNGIIFADGTKMTTAVSGGAPSGTSIVSAINDPATTGTINDNRLSANLARLDSANTFNGSQTVNGNININGSGTVGGTLSANRVSVTDALYTSGWPVLRAGFNEGMSIGLFTGGGGFGNTYIGYQTANVVSDGENNTFVGKQAGFPGGAHGSGNTLLGADTDIADSLFNATAIGVGAAVTQSNSMVLGNGSVYVGIGTTAPQYKLHAIDPSNKGLRVQTNLGGGTVASFGSKGEFQIDSPGIAGGRLNVRENGTVILGDCPGCYPVNDRLIVGGTIRVGATGSGGSISLCINSLLQISTCSSSIRYKTNIANFSSGLNLINRLRPVTFDWKADKAHDLGLVAEEVAEVEPLLVIHNSKGEVEGVKYDRLNVVLVNAIKEQQAQIKSQADAFAALQQENLEMKRRLAALEQSLRQQR